MARAEDTEVIDRFEQFYRDYYRNEIGELAQKYPNEKRSLYVDWNDLYRFDPDIADDFLAQPDQMRDYAEEALRLYDLPVDVKLGQAHVRVENLQETTDIRDIRARHRGQLIAVTGIVRKATDVRPKVTEAAFECQRCGTLTRIPQTSGEFYEPHECQGCERQGPFEINFDQSEFVDAQKLRVQESPEGLRGGETPQSIDVHIDDDITGQVTAGDHVRVTGVLHLDQQGSDQDKSPVFDVYMDGITVDIEDEQFEDMDITDEDKKEIIELSNAGDIYEQMVNSIAPSIYGYEQEKLAMMLQLFSGVTKHLPDGSRIRGDLHMLLIGDPGTGKCLKGDTRVTLADGRERQIGPLVESRLDDPTPVADGVYDEVDIPLVSMAADGQLERRRATKVWKREAPDRMYRIRTACGKELEVTPSHPLFVQNDGRIAPVDADDLAEGEFVALPRRLPTDGDEALEVDGVEANTNVDVIPGIGDELEAVRRALALSQSDCGIPRATYQHYKRGDRNPSRSSLRRVVAGFEERLEWLHEAKARIEAGSWADVEAVREELNLSQRELAERMGVEQTAVSYYERNEVAPDGGRTAAARVAVLDRIEQGLAVEDRVESLRELTENDVRWSRIETIETVVPEYDWVYDLEVPDTHSYVSNGVVSHNSAMLQYIRNVAPRSVYTSGKGSSSAGLTAAAVRDDFGDGQQWTLEAGALVLADQGIAAVDELDKMRCVTGDTLVHLADGRVSRIGDIARSAAETGTVEERSNGRTIRDLDLAVWTMTENNRLVRRSVSAVHEYDAPPELSEVSLESGESVTATDDHPFFVFEDGKRVERRAAELDPGDWVYVPEELPPSVTDGGETVSTVARSDVPVADPSPAFGAVLGYLSGDGNVYYDREQGSYGIRFTNEEEELLEGFERACRDAFDAEPVRHPSEQRDDGVGTVRLHGREYADSVLDAGMNLETYDGKAFPGRVSEGGRKTKAAFVRAVADSEGNVDTATGNVRIYSSSRELLRGVKSLLLEFGISCQVRSRNRTDRRDLYVLAITSADSLRAYNRYVGFTSDRKQRALEEVCAAVGGDRAILDVLPESGDLLAELRSSLRLHQSECGLDGSTYCDFESGDANVSLHRARTVLDAFEDRVDAARADEETLSSECDWATLGRVKDRYHVSQRELAEGTAYSQQEISRRWGSEAELRETIRGRLGDLVGDVAGTDLGPLAALVRGDVRWRRVSDVRSVSASEGDDRVPILRQELADILDCEPEASEREARRFIERTPDPDPGTWTELRQAMDRHDVPLNRVASDLGVAGSTVSRWFSGAVETDRFEEVRRAVESRVSETRSRVRELLDEIEHRQEPRVYDLTVEGTHNFVANGMVVHNSEDRSAMHEALEQQSISVSKAGINATLKSRCSLLGAANPKYGRFDQYEPIGEQIDLEPALISRFDLIFTVTDEPDEEEDANLAEHIINTNYAGELHTHRENTATSNVTQEEVDNVTEEVEPDIEPELLRKYIAHAKRNCYPTMTEEAKKEIREFYVDLRAEGQGEDAPVPVTARKLEALVRLSEASARMRLSDTVEAKDAEQVIEIVRSCLQDIGVDPETGEFDADVVETGQSKSQRDRIKNIKSLISEVEEEYDNGAPREEVLERAEEAGMERSKAEHEIEKLRQKGDVYEPQTDHLRTV